MSYEETPATGPHRPHVVAAGAGLLAILGLISAGRVAYGVLVNLSQEQWSSGARAMFLLLNSIVLVFALFILVLADQVRRGRQWAWVVSLVLLPFAVLVGGLLVLTTALGDAVPFAGLGVLLASLAALLLLTVPPAARAYFLRRPTVAMPHHAGAVPGPSWAPAPPPPPATERRPSGS